MPGLDGLRALAVFAVMAYHLGLPFVPGGFLGVTLFFVLSGYLITDLLLAEWNRRGTVSFKSFYIRRAKRLFPGIILMLVCTVGYIGLFQPELMSNFKAAVLPAALFFSNWWYIFTDMPYFASFATPSLLNHFWSLAVEAQFYLLWPVLLVLGQRFIKQKWLKLLITALLAIVSAALMALLFQPGYDPSRIYYGTDTRMFSLLLGACLAYIYPSARLVGSAPTKKHRVIIDTTGLIALASVIFTMYYITQYDDMLYVGGMFLFSIVCVVLIAVAANSATVLGRVLGIKPLRFVGKISYGIYLWHYPVIILTNALFPSSRLNAVLIVFQVAASILLAAVSYYLVENPIRKTTVSKETIRAFCQYCLYARWWKKTAVIMIVTVVLITSTNLITGHSSPTAIDDNFAQSTDLPSSDIGLPEEPEISTTPDVSPPAPETEPTPLSNTGSQPDPSQAPPGPDDGTPEPSDTPANASAEIIPCDLNITVIGDSITIDYAPYLEAYYPNMHVEAEVGRQFFQAYRIIEQLKENNQLTSTVVIALGSNGAFSEAKMRNLIDLIGSDISIVFVNTQVPRSWCATVNDMLADISADYSNTIIADWYSISTGHNEYFYKDGVHPNKTGSPVIAKAIAEAIKDIHPYKPYIPVN